MMRRPHALNVFEFLSTRMQDQVRERILVSEKDAKTDNSHGNSEILESASEKRQKKSVLHVYRQLYLLRQLFNQISPKIAKTQDRLLASIAYPSRLLGYVFSAGRLTKLSKVVGDYRTLSRVVTTPAVIADTLNVLANSNSNYKSNVDRWIDYLQAISGLLYQVLEDLAYFGDKGLLKISSQLESKFWIYSSVFWAIDVAITLFKVVQENVRDGKPLSLRRLVVNLAWAPLTIHWSTEKGLLNDGWVGLLGTIACWPNMVYQWRNA